MRNGKYLLYSKNIIKVYGAWISRLHEGSEVTVSLFNKFEIIEYVSHNDYHRNKNLLQIKGVKIPHSSFYNTLKIMVKEKLIERHTYDTDKEYPVMRYIFTLKAMKEYLKYINSNKKYTKRPS